MATEIIEYFNNQSPLSYYISISIIASIIRLGVTIFYSHFWRVSTI